MAGCRIITDLEYRGVETVVVENSAVRIVLLPGKGGDVIEFRDKRTDENVMFETDHEWRTPGETYVPPTGETWMDYYPGGWQDVLPFTEGAEHRGADYGLHGESCLLPWDATVVTDTPDCVQLHLEARLTRYPFHVEKTLTLERDSSVLGVEQTVTNESEVDAEYLWLQHVALGQPLVAPGASIEIPAKTVVSLEPVSENGRIASHETFEWPVVRTTDGQDLDVSEVPEDPRHDVSYVTDLTDGWYGVRHPDLDLGFGFVFDESLFECIWLWQAYGGFEQSPYFNRSWNLGVEPATGYPGWDFPDAARDNGTLDTLGGGESVTTTYHATTYEDHEELMAVADR